MCVSLFVGVCVWKIPCQDHFPIGLTKVSAYHGQG